MKTLNSHCSTLALLVSAPAVLPSFVKLLESPRTTPVNGLKLSPSFVLPSNGWWTGSDRCHGRL